MSLESYCEPKQHTNALQRRSGTTNGRASYDDGNFHETRETELRVESPADSESDTDSSDKIDVGMDGSLVEHYRGFDMMRSTLREVEEIGPQDEALIRFGLEKVGSGVGAALVAQAATATNKHIHVGMAK